LLGSNSPTEKRATRQYGFQVSEYATNRALI
jgi:hypothetical protein